MSEALKNTRLSSHKQGDVLGIMHVYNPPLEGSLSCFEPANPPYYEKEKLQKHMEHVMTNLEPKPSRLNYTCMVQDGVNVAESIVESAENFGSDIVIVGTHGAGNREDVLLGSHAWDVIQKSRVPVLAVPDGTDL